jgi:hypothetical protein
VVASYLGPASPGRTALLAVAVVMSATMAIVVLVVLRAGPLRAAEPSPGRGTGSGSDLGC